MSQNDQTRHMETTAPAGMQSDLYLFPVVYSYFWIAVQLRRMSYGDFKDKYKLVKSL